jgi:hypothetical protein
MSESRGRRGTGCPLVEAVCGAYEGLTLRARAGTDSMNLAIGGRTRPGWDDGFAAGGLLGGGVLRG